MKKLVWLILPVVAMVVAVAFFRGFSGPGAESPSSPSSPGNSSSSSATLMANETVATRMPPPEAGVRPEFVNFLSEEARRVDSPQVNAEQAEVEARSHARMMTEEDMEYAEGLVVKRASTANVRILSVYMLSLVGKRAWPHLRDIVVNAAGGDRPAVHSMEEQEVMQRKAEERMAADALLDQAAKDPQARDELARWAQETKDEGLREYILKKLQELRSGT